MVMSDALQKCACQSGERGIGEHLEIIGASVCGIKILIYY